MVIDTSIMPFVNYHMSIWSFKRPPEYHAERSHYYPWHSVPVYTCISVLYTHDIVYLYIPVYQVLYTNDTVYLYIPVYQCYIPMTQCTCIYLYISVIYQWHSVPVYTCISGVIYQWHSVPVYTCISVLYTHDIVYLCIPVYQCYIPMT